MCGCSWKTTCACSDNFADARPDRTVRELRPYLARWYRWLEYAGFGRALERRRTSVSRHEMTTSTPRPRPGRRRRALPRRLPADQRARRGRLRGQQRENAGPCPQRRMRRQAPQAACPFSPCRCLARWQPPAVELRPDRHPLLPRLLHGRRTPPARRASGGRSRLPARVGSSPSSASRRRGLGGLARAGVDRGVVRIFPRAR